MSHYLLWHPNNTILGPKPSERLDDGGKNLDKQLLLFRSESFQSHASIAMDNSNSKETRIKNFFEALKTNEQNSREPNWIKNVGNNKYKAS